jgi:hypothetical protein
MIRILAPLRWYVHNQEAESQCGDFRESFIHLKIKL